MANNFDPTLSWTDDEVGSTQKLNQMVQNENILYNLIPHYMYRRGETGLTDFNDSQSRVLKPTIFSGRVAFYVAGKYGQSRVIGFPSGTFAPSSAPAIIATPAAGQDHERYVTCTISAIDGSRVVGNEGFRVNVYHRDGEKFQSHLSIHYVAFGWQEA